MTAISGSDEQCIGLIGLGLVGAALAKRFLAAGFHVIGFDLNEDRRREAEAQGVRIVSTSTMAAKEAPRIVLSLPNSNVVKDVILHEEGILSSAPHVSIIDTTTGDPSHCEEIAQRIEEAGGTYIDACIIGSSTHVAKGEAIVSAGGMEEALDRCRDILDTFAKRVFHMGDVGKGSQAKLVVNLVLGLNRFVLSEGLLLADALNIDLPQILELLKSGVSYSRVMDTKGPKIINRDYQPEARLSQHLKDVDLIIQLGRKTGVPLYLSQLHHIMLQTGVSSGLGELDNSAIFEVLRGQFVDLDSESFR